MSEDRAPIWTLGAIIVFFKVLAVVLVMWYDGSRQAVEAAIAINWPIFVFFLLLVPLAGWRLRLVRVRLKRRKLIEQEWNVRESAGTGRGRR
jgi:hypothetical protein